MVKGDMSEVRTVEVRYPGGVYPVWIGPAVRYRLGEWSAVQPYTRRAFVITDTHVASLYGQDVQQALAEGGFTVHMTVIPAGEQHKTLDTVRQIYDALVTAGVDRRCPVIALGGGVVGDVAGFVAATILRGVPFIQVPTTLLAMVDASVGGKTGVDLPQGKNLVGAFKFPDLVVADVETLATLPDVEFACGLAEVIKHGLIGDPTILERVQPPGALSSAQLTELVQRAVQVKVQVVEEDPFEQGRRAVLNLGHTFAHALEQVTAYRLRHGLAVALGLVAAADLGVRLNMASQDLLETIRSVLRRAALPTHWRETGIDMPAPPPESVLAAMQLDKKRLHGRLRFIVPRSVGEVTVVSDVPPTAVVEAVRAILV